MNHNTPKNFIDLTGRRIGRLVVCHRLPNRGVRTFWHCKCDCGKTKDVTSHSLTQGLTKSCGCLQKEATQTLVIDLTGQKFGRLTVIRRVGYIGEKHPSIVWECKCDCGKIATVRAQSLRRGETRSCGCLSRENRVNNIWKNRKKYPTIDRKAAVEKYVCRRIYEHCRKNEHGCELTMTDVKALAFAACHYCGKIGGREYRDYDKKAHRLISDTVIRYNGIDRIDSSKGYTIDNVVTCCWDCNRAKNTMSVDDFKSWVSRIYHHLFHV